MSMKNGRLSASIKTSSQRICTLVFPVTIVHDSWVRRMDGLRQIEKEVIYQEFDNGLNRKELSRLFGRHGSLYLLFKIAEQIRIKKAPD